MRVSVSLVLLFILIAVIGVPVPGGGAWRLSAGDVLWQDQVERQAGGQAPAALPVANSTGRVFVAGHRQGDFHVRAYDEAKGTLLWVDEEVGGSDRATAVTASAALVFAAGGVQQDFAIRAYEAKTGAPLWSASKPLMSLPKGA